MNALESKSLPHVNRHGQVSVCMCCYPTLEIFFAAFPHLRGEEVTSTYCRACFDREIVARYSPNLIPQAN